MGEFISIGIQNAAYEITAILLSEKNNFVKGVKHFF